VNICDLNSIQKISSELNLQSEQVPPLTEILWQLQRFEARIHLCKTCHQPQNTHNPNKRSKPKPIKSQRITVRSDPQFPKSLWMPFVHLFPNMIKPISINRKILQLKVNLDRRMNAKAFEERDVDILRLCKFL
jgi:hypothetical protein